MRLSPIPRSLYARIVLLVIGMLLLAQLLSMLILFDERARWFLQSRVNRNSQRIAEAVRVVDAQPADRRVDVAASFASQGFAVEIVVRKPALPHSDPDLADVAAEFLDDLKDARSGDDPVDVALRYAGDPPPRDWWLNPFVVPVPATRLDVALPTRDGGAWFAVHVELAADARGLPDRVLWDMLVRLVVLVGFLLLVVRWISRPLSTLALAADRFGRNLDEPPLPETGPSEVVRAAQAFNRMQVRLRDLVREKGRMLAAVSHDLKTPITRLRLRAELLPDAGLRAKVGRDLDEMESMVSATLDLMRGAANAEPLQRTDVVALVESLADDYEDTGRTIAVEAGRTAPIEVRPQALRRCIANLVDNGLKYATNVAVRIADAGDTVTIDVEDEGPGIPTAELERVLEPFHRLEGSRNRETGGSGLGLSIARAIAIEHAGTLTLSNRVPTGLKASVRLPRR